MFRFHSFNYQLFEDASWSLQAALAKMKRKRKCFAGNLQSTASTVIPTPRDTTHSPRGSHGIPAWWMGVRGWPGPRDHAVSPTLSELRTKSSQIYDSSSWTKPIFKKILWETSGWAQMGSGRLQKGRRWHWRAAQSRHPSPGASSWTQMAWPIHIALPWHHHLHQLPISNPASRMESC